MKARMFTVFIAIVGLALFLAWNVTAQGPELGDLLPDPRPAGEWDRAMPFSRPTVPGNLVAEGADVLAVPMGQPGTSFRYVQTFGVTEEPYPADTAHLNHPNGLFIDGSDNLYVVEENGFRLLKFNASGVNQLVVGHAGLPFHHEDYLSYPKDIAVNSSDGHFWVVMNNAIKKFEADGTVVQWFPDADPWSSGSDNGHFNDPTGIAFDSAGRLYVSDHWNHRIQVYTFTMDGGLVYSATIGVTSESGSDNAHFNEPQHIAVYGNSLYIADASNHRVQIYTIGASSVTYTATIGVSGESGDDNDHLNWPSGVAVSASYIYVADSDNHRVQVFNRSTRAYVATIGTGWGTGDTQFKNPRDVVVDSTGNIYVSDWNNARVQQFDSSRVYQHTYGVTDVPYVADNVRLNGPWGVAVDGAGSIYATEQWGQRLVKLDATGVQQWAVGQAGVTGSDNAHWSWPEGNLAVDSAGRIYAPDTGNHRIQIFNSNGAYFTTLGNEDCNPGNGLGDKEFCSPRGVAVGSNGRIYVADSDNHRVQVFDSNHVYTATLGVTGVSGSDNVHFNYPHGVAVDASGNIYVADRDNHRVQKCTLSGSSYTCTTFAGITGECGTDFDHLCGPRAVAADASGWVYVADGGNDGRIQVFDSSGAYLTTIGGSWGSNTGQIRFPTSVAVDAQGNVYVAQQHNHRIQKFASGVPGWRQVNINGFGERGNESVPALEMFNGQLYAGTVNWNDGARIWRMSDGATWTAVSDVRFGSAYPANTAVWDMIVFKGQLYAGTGWSTVGGRSGARPTGRPGRRWKATASATLTTALSRPSASSAIRSTPAPTICTAPKSGVAAPEIA